MNRSTFNAIVEKCMRSEEYFGSIIYDGTPVEIQVATVFWSFTNGHYGYRITEVTLGVSPGSYRNFTERFLSAMMTISKTIITWPINDPERATNIANGFMERGETEQLDQVIGAIDGKNIVIQKPKRRGKDYVDRKGRASVNTMAVCDHEGRYMFLKLGVLDNYDFTNFSIVLIHCN